jgi:hypothetical protein
MTKPFTGKLTMIKLSIISFIVVILGDKYKPFPKYSHAVLEELMDSNGKFCE